jgi:hypothetical protein
MVHTTCATMSALWPIMPQLLWYAVETVRGIRIRLGR